MKLTYDPDHNIAYIRFREKVTEAETVRVSDEVNVDIAPDGSVFGIELMNANRQLTEDADGVLVLINELTGQQLEMPLTPK